jgi:NADH:ubiquinone oxidoreductase subunit E
MPKIQICKGKNCGKNNAADRIFETLNDSGFNDIEFCGCTGYCELGPNVIADGKIYHGSKTKDIAERIKNGDGVTLKKITIEDINLDEDLI